MSDIQTLQAKAIQAERLARTQTDAVISARLLALASEYSERVRELNAALH
jgi:hypothetical protein